VVKRKLYLWLREQEALEEVVDVLFPQNREMAALLAQLQESLEQQGDLFVDGLALCDSPGAGRSINYYIKMR